jgi:hypothetical protein
MYWEFGKYKHRHISKTPYNYIDWLVSTKVYNKLSKGDKESLSEYMNWYRETHLSIKKPDVEPIINTTEWNDISELPDIDSEVEVKPFTAILTFKGDYFINEKGKAVSVYLVDEWRYTDRYLETLNQINKSW